MLSPLRLWLAGLRLALLYAIGCALVLGAGLQTRLDREHDQGRQSPLPPVTSPIPFLGVTADFTGLTPAQIDTALAELAAAGFGWVRLRVGWDQVEPNPGVWRWAETDVLLDAVAQSGLAPVLVLDGSPAWARGPQDQSGPDAALAPPADFMDFADFADAVARRYAARVRVYQVWDEPNISPHWGNHHIEPVDYARLLKTAAPAIRQADPDALILLAALAPTADRGHTAVDEVYFLQRVYAAGAAPAFDAVAIQPFGFGMRPDDPATRLDVLNFRRAVVVRQAMLAAGDGATPVWIVRFGWSRGPNSPFGSVSPERQIGYAVAALDMAYREWPWVAAQGWTTQGWSALPGDPSAGFRLTPDLAGALAGWTAGTAASARPVPAASSVGTQAEPWLALAGLALLWLWRSVATLRLLPWDRWRERWRMLPAWQQGLGWVSVLAVYWLASWPPLIVLCWAAAALLIWAHPASGPLLALILLPFFFQHKEVHWVNTVWTVPPTYAALLCTLPVVGLFLARNRNRVSQKGPGFSLFSDRWGALAAGWLLVMVCSATGVWYWPAYSRGLVDHALAPLTLFALIVAWPPAARRPERLAAALFAGGVLVALLGLGDWLRGGGTEADSLLRLVGPFYSPNQTALYLERTLLLGLGLALAAPAHRRLLPAAACGLVSLALLLTGSRGAILLGLPAGLVVLALLGWPVSRRRLSPRGIWVGIALAAVSAGIVVWLLGPRLTNSATIQERLRIWAATLALWRDYPLFGVGPGGFVWRFPAYIPLGGGLNPNLRHPHNLWLEYATTGGVAGLLWLLAALGLVAAWVYRCRGQLEWPQAALLAALAAGLAHGQVDAFQALPELAVWNWGALALILAWPAGRAHQESTNVRVTSTPEDDSASVQLTAMFTGSARASRRRFPL